MSDPHSQKKAGLGFTFDNYTVLPCSEGGSWLHCEDKTPAALHQTSVHPGYLANTLPTALLSTSVCVPKYPALLSLPLLNPALREEMHSRLLSPAPHPSLQSPGISCLKIITASGMMGNQHWAVMTFLRDFFLRNLEPVLSG